MRYDVICRDWQKGGLSALRLFSLESETRSRPWTCLWAGLLTTRHRPLCRLALREEKKGAWPDMRDTGEMPEMIYQRNYVFFTLHHLNHSPPQSLGPFRDSELEHLFPPSPNRKKRDELDRSRPELTHLMYNGSVKKNLDHCFQENQNHVQNQDQNQVQNEN